MAVPPVKGLDEACAWLRKAALTPFPPVTKSEQDYGHGRNKTRTRAKLQHKRREQPLKRLISKTLFIFSLFYNTSKPLENCARTTKTRANEHKRAQIKGVCGRTNRNMIKNLLSAGHCWARTLSSFLSFRSPTLSCVSVLRHAVCPVCPRAHP